jgi:hypothetical protein
LYFLFKLSNLLGCGLVYVDLLSSLLFMRLDGRPRLLKSLELCFVTRGRFFNEKLPQNLGLLCLRGAVRLQDEYRFYQGAESLILREVGPGWYVGWSLASVVIGRDVLFQKTFCLRISDSIITRRV